MINGTVNQWLYAFSQTEKFLCITNYIKKKYNLDSNLLPIWDHEVIIRSVFRDPKYMEDIIFKSKACLLYTSPSPRDRTRSRMPSSA